MSGFTIQGPERIDTGVGKVQLTGKRFRDITAARGGGVFVNNSIGSGINESMIVDGNGLRIPANSSNNHTDSGGNVYSNMNPDSIAYEPP